MIDTAANIVVATVPTGSQQIHVAITPDGKFAYVTNLVGESVSVINTSTNAVVATVALGHRPGEVAITPDGAFAYVTTGSNGVVVIRTATNRVVAKVPVVAYGLAISDRIATPPTSTTVPGSTTTSMAGSRRLSGPPGTALTVQPPSLPVTGSGTLPATVLGGALIASGALMTLRRHRRTT